MAHPASTCFFPIPGSHLFERIGENHPQHCLSLWERARVRVFWLEWTLVYALILARRRSILHHHVRASRLNHLSYRIFRPIINQVTGKNEEANLLTPGPSPAGAEGGRQPMDSGPWIGASGLGRPGRPRLFSHRRRSTPTRSQYANKAHREHFGDTGAQRFCPKVTRRSLNSIQ